MGNVDEHLLKGIWALLEKLRVWSEVPLHLCVERSNLKVLRLLKS